MRRMRQISGLCGVALAAFAWTVPASAQDLIGSPGAATFDDRSAPSNYQYDNAATIFLRWSTAPRDALMMQRFDAVGGADVLNSVSIRFGTLPAGRAAKIYIWSYPGGTVAPTNCVLLHQQDVTIGSAGGLNTYPLTSPVPVTGVFFVGASVIQQEALEAPYTVDKSSGYTVGRSWIGYSFAGVDGANLAGLDSLRDLQNVGHPGYLHVRANGNGSSFAYQGRLASAGQNYTGAADLLFTVYDSQEGGSVVGVPVTMVGVPVTAGVFSVQIPADPSMFVNAPDRYLDVQVRTPADGNTFKSITPRQRIGQVPAAMVATVAQSAQSAQTVPWSGISGVPESVTAWQPTAGGVFYGGNVGIGTASPLAALHIVGGPPYANAQIETGYTDGTWLNLLNSSPNGRSWSLISTGSTNTEGAGALLIRDNDVSSVRAAFLPNGNVGFGTITPSRRVQVKGDGIGFSHISSDGSTEVASFADANFGTFGTFTNKTLLLMSNGTGYVSVTPQGRMGVGTTAPADALDVRCNIRLGADGEYQAVGSNAENLTMIRGIVNAIGTIRWSSGFTVTRSGIGQYRISWSASPGFKNPPSPTATGYLAVVPVVAYSSNALTNADGSGYVDFRVVNLSGVLVDATFSFTLVGPR